VGTEETHRDKVRSSKVSYDPRTGAYSHVTDEGDEPPAGKSNQIKCVVLDNTKVCSPMSTRNTADILSPARPVISRTIDN